MDAFLLAAFLAGFKHTNIVFESKSIDIFDFRAKVHVTSIIDPEAGRDTTSRICPCDVVIKPKNMEDSLLSVKALSDDSLFDHSAHSLSGNGPPDIWIIDVARERMDEAFLLEFKKTKGRETGLLDSAVFSMKRDTSTCWVPFCLFRNW